MDVPSNLKSLGERVGILPEYVNFDGTKRVLTSEETYAAILRSLGFSLDEEALKRALQSFPAGGADLHQSANPVRCVSVEQRTGNQQARGIWVNLYSIRSATNWSVGDFGDLRRLVKWAGEMELDFVAINPLHALRNFGHDISPYRPVSRLYRNEIYLELEAITEFEADLGEDEQTGWERNEVRTGTVIDYGEVSRLKREWLKPMYRSFKEAHEGGKTQRGAEYLQFLEREGAALDDFATFTVFDEMIPLGEDWRNPANQYDWAMLDCRSAKVQEFREWRADEIGFHQYVQFELDRQLASIAEYAKECGLSIGLMGDLAIGTAPDGSDPWAYPDLFLRGVSIGAPPDDLGPQGQNWGLPPLNPHKLRETEFEFFRRLLRNNLAHMGALRIDHVMGLLRQFWIPEGFDGSKGAYMRFPAEELFTILAEESRRSGAVILGEDLGTVPEGFRELLERYGVLSTRVVHFEREWDGTFKAASTYPASAYTVVGTHDMVPLAGYVEGRDLELRRQVGLIPDEEALRQAMVRRGEEWGRLKDRLRQEGLAIEQGDKEIESACRALVKFLYASPSCMVGISLDDLAGEREPVNVPGVGQDRHPSWSRRMKMSLEEITSSSFLRGAQEAERP